MDKAAQTFSTEAYLLYVEVENVRRTPPIRKIAPQNPKIQPS